MEEIVAVLLLLPGLVFLFGIVLLGLMRFREGVPLRRRGICAKCGYSLRGNTSGTCPECGLKISTSSM